MAPLETKPNGRNIHMLIQVENGEQYVVLDRHFIQNGVNHANLKWYERFRGFERPELAAARIGRLVSAEIRPQDYEVYNARALTPEPNYFMVWFATMEQFEDCSARWYGDIVHVSAIEGITPRKQAALARICVKAAKQYAMRLLQAA